MSTNVPDLQGRSYLPARASAGSLTPWQQYGVSKSLQRANRELIEYGIQADVETQKFFIDTVALGQAVGCALDEELSFMAYGLSRAGNSNAALELVARKLDLFSHTNDRRITRRFS